MEKKTIKTRFLAGVLALTMAGSTTSALALEKNNDKAGQTVEITETMLDEKTKELKEALGEEYYSFLQSIGVEVVNGNLNVTTAEQFKAIGDYYNETIERLGFKPYNVCDELFVVNFDFLSPDLKQELVDKKIVNECKSETPLEMSRAIYPDELLNTVCTKIFSAESETKLLPYHLLNFSVDAIISFNKLSQYRYDVNKKCKNKDQDEYTKLIEDFTCYLFDEENSLGMTSPSKLPASFCWFIDKYVTEVYMMGMTAGFGLPEDNRMVKILSGEIKEGYVSEMRVYLKRVILEYPTSSKTKKK